MALSAILLFSLSASADTGYGLWFPDMRIQNSPVASVKVSGTRSRVAMTAADELRQRWDGLPVTLKIKKGDGLSEEGFRIAGHRRGITIESPSPAGLLYGVWRLLREKATGRIGDAGEFEITDNPALGVRVLNHWDNPDGTIERGYAGRSIWQWDSLPSVVSPRYRDYARANSSVGINGVVLNNVNASPSVLSRENLEKVKVIADILRDYNIKVYLSVNFASPMALDSLPTADPLDEEVRRWWRDKGNEIYSLIPDFGGFLVKANSEGQPGPCDFGRTHAEGANMLAESLRPHGGTVMWRSFVYSPSDADRAKQAYMEFKPLDGKFGDNVSVQIKNGPIDFQPREPYSPLFGAMTSTPCMAELQITQEYLGQANHLVFLAPMWKEFFSYVDPSTLSGVAGVANIGDDINWCGHPFGAANWYSFGRLAWNPELTSEEIAEEWLRQTFVNVPEAELPLLTGMMTSSREAAVDYMMPLGLHHIFAFGHHYGPEPWCDVEGAREDWLPRYYHRADSTGLGFDRTVSGSDAVSQYPASFAGKVGNLSECPEEFLLWFHHVPWSHRMKSGLTLWEELCRRYDRGVTSVRDYQKTWARMRPYVDEERYLDVERRLQTQARDAQWWKDACLLYFSGFSGEPVPADIEQPVHQLHRLRSVELPISNYENPTSSLLDTLR